MRLLPSTLCPLVHGGNPWLPHTLAECHGKRTNSASGQQRKAVVNSEKTHEGDEEGEESPAMQATVSPEQRQAAKCEIIRQVEQGASAQEARVHSAVPMHRATVYRLLKRVQSEGR